jgi:hypothetical protein
MFKEFLKNESKAYIIDGGTYHNIKNHHINNKKTHKEKKT